MGKGPLPMEVEKGVYMVVFVGATQGSRLHSQTCAGDSQRRGRIKRNTLIICFILHESQLSISWGKCQAIKERAHLAAYNSLKLTKSALSLELGHNLRTQLTTLALSCELSHNISTICGPFLSKATFLTLQRRQTAGRCRKSLATIAADIVSETSYTVR